MNREVNFYTLYRGAKHQGGVVLAVSLIVLVMLTVLISSMVHVTSMGEKMTGNAKDQALAFQYAEMALRVGEARIETIRKTSSLTAFCNNTAGLFKAQSVTLGGSCATQPPNPNQPSTWTDTSKSVGVNTNNTKLANQPRYFIVFNTYRAPVGSKPPMYGFTVYAHANGMQSSTHVILKSFYGGEVNFP